MSIVNIILRIPNVIMDVIRKRDIKESPKTVENRLTNGEERPTPRIILVIFPIVLYATQFSIGQNNVLTNVEKRMIIGPCLRFECNFRFLQMPYFGCQVTIWACSAQLTLVSKLPLQLGSKGSQSSVEYLR